MTKNTGDIMRQFGFTFDIIGKATIVIDAESLELAMEILENKLDKSEVSFDLDEWDIKYPKEGEDLKKYLAFDDPL